MLNEYERARLSIAAQIVAFLCVFGGLGIGGWVWVCASLAETFSWAVEARSATPAVEALATALRWCGAAIAGAGCAVAFGLRIVRIATLSKVSDA